MHAAVLAYILVMWLILIHCHRQHQLHARTSSVFRLRVDRTNELIGR